MADPKSLWEIGMMDDSVFYCRAVTQSDAYYLAQRAWHRNWLDKDMTGRAEELFAAHHSDLEAFLNSCREEEHGGYSMCLHSARTVTKVPKGSAILE